MNFLIYACMSFWLVIGFAIILLEIVKIVLFNQTNGELQLNIIDYVYLAYLICVSICICFSCRNRSRNREENDNYIKILAVFISIVIYVLYICFTINEMGDIPFFCPEDYPYTTPLIRIACLIRTINLLILWIVSGLSLILVGCGYCIYYVYYWFVTRPTDNDIEFDNANNNV